MKLRMMTRTEPDLGLDDLALKPVDEFDHTVHGTGKSQLSAFVPCTRKSGVLTE